MSDDLKSSPEKSQTEKTRSIASEILSDGTLVEMLHLPEEHRTLLCLMKDGAIRYESSVLHNGQRLVPYSPSNNLLVHEVVLFPSEALEYESEQDLLREIQSFIHTYVDVSPLFEQIAAYYVLLSWVYDSFNELPYLRVRGDTGSGKTRCLVTVGSLCYKPIFASGASTVSPIFRIIDSFRGTLIVDEGDFRFSDEKAEIIKILNNGNARGFPVLRSESTNGKEFDPRAYHVFGPKMIATRNYFEDRALETRCLTEETGGRKLRDDIPLNLGDDSKMQARVLRNKLLLFRFQTYGRKKLDPSLADRTIEPRLAQLFMPLLSIIDDASAREALVNLAREYHQELIADRGMDMEAHVLEIIRDILTTSPNGYASIKDIASRFAYHHGEEYDKRITPKWIGSIIRRTLQLKTQKSNGVFVLVPTEKAKLTKLYEKYGIASAAQSGTTGTDSPVHG